MSAYEIVRSLNTKYYTALIDNFSNTAILMNAVNLAVERYTEGNVGLTTATNIPREFLTAGLDVNYVFSNENLIKAYQNDIVKKIATDYIIATISTLDAFSEDLYDALLRFLFNDPNRETKVASLWRNNQFRNFLINDLQITPSLVKRTTPSMAFDRYEEFRTIRHAIVHSRGELSQNQLTTLRKIKQRGTQRGESILDSEFIQGNQIKLDYSIVFILRKFAFEFVSYTTDCVLFNLEQKK